MLGPGRYLLGVVEIALLVGCAWLGAGEVRRRLLPAFRGLVGGLATAVLALALLIWCAEILGTFSLFEPVPYLVLVASMGLGLWWSLRRSPGGGIPHPHLQVGVRVSSSEHGAHDELNRSVRGGESAEADAWAGESVAATAVALVIAAVAVVHFAAGVKAKLSTGMTGFDSTWYHGPFAAGFFQGGDTFDLHFIAPQFLAWFYPANGEIFHGAGMLAFSRDLLSPLLNLGWFLGCLVACWCVGRPYRVGAWSLALGAVALSVPALHDQAGEARNDVVGIFFLLAAVAVAVNAWGGWRDGKEAGGEEGSAGAPGRAPATLPAQVGRPAPSPCDGAAGVGALVVAGLAAGLAAGTKLNFLLPAAVLVLGLTLVAPRGARWRALWVGGLAALAGGGYWYLRNLVHSGNPLPWVHHLGPITLPAPEQALGGREAHSVLSYLTDGSVWSDWLLPGLHHGLWILWPVLALAAFAGLLLPLLPSSAAFWPHSDQKAALDWSWDRVLLVAGVVGLASALAWLVAPTSASGPEEMPRGFESGLRYLAPALVLGLALLPTAPQLRRRLANLADRLTFVTHRVTKVGGRVTEGTRKAHVRRWALAGVALVLLAVAVGYPVQRHYLRERYADPSFSAPGLDAAFKWARDVSGARIATTSTRQYPLFGTDLSNHVQYVGVERPHGGFEAPTSCPQWRRLLNDGNYDYVVTSRDRIEPGKPPFPPSTRWTESPQAEVILRKPPTVVFKLRGQLDPSACGS